MFDCELLFDISALFDCELLFELLWLSSSSLSHHERTLCLGHRVLLMSSMISLSFSDDNALVLALLAAARPEHLGILQVRGLLLARLRDGLVPRSVFLVPGCVLGCVHLAVARRSIPMMSPARPVHRPLSRGRLVHRARHMISSLAVCAVQLLLQFIRSRPRTVALVPADARAERTTFNSRLKLLTMGTVHHHMRGHVVGHRNAHAPVTN